MKVGFGCVFDSPLPDKVLKREVRGLLRGSGVRHFMLIDQRSSALFPIPVAVRYLAGVWHWEVPVLVKLVIYAVWIPLMPVLIIIFALQAIVCGRAIRADAKKEPRWYLSPEGEFGPAQAIGIVGDVAGLAAGPIEASFVISDQQEGPDEPATENEPEKREISLDEFRRLDPGQEQNFRDVVWCVSVRPETNARQLRHI